MRVRGRFDSFLVTQRVDVPRMGSTTWNGCLAGFVTRAGTNAAVDETPMRDIRQQASRRKKILRSRFLLTRPRGSNVHVR